MILIQYDSDQNNATATRFQIIRKPSLQPLLFGGIMEDVHPYEHDRVFGWTTDHREVYLAYMSSGHLCST